MYLVSSLFERPYQLVDLVSIDQKTNLIEEDILAISAFSCKVLQVPILVDSVLLA
jgi:hypothetical protein